MLKKTKIKIDKNERDEIVFSLDKKECIHMSHMTQTFLKFDFFYQFGLSALLH